MLLLKKRKNEKLLENTSTEKKLYEKRLALLTSQIGTQEEKFVKRVEQYPEKILCKRTKKKEKN